ncbi:MAG TPA: STAS domain-containing protein [Solirubrobacteraceae bacterium]|nr:STAS domain-containing protein [Solirubrobacteraceae bacterium]
MDLDTTSFSTRVRIQKCDDAHVVSLHGEHDISSAPLVRERLAHARDAGGRIVVDLSAANFIDSTIAGTLVEAFRADTPPRLRLVMPADTVPRRVFYRMGFGTGLPVYERLEDALADQAVR